MIIVNLNDCIYSNTQNYSNTYYTQIQSWSSWVEYYWHLRPPRYEYIRPQPVPQLRLKPKYVPPYRRFQKQRFPSRVVALNRSNYRNHYKRNN